VHWGVVPVEEPLPLQSKMAVQDATDGDIRCPMGKRPDLQFIFS
jgi:hypothetical protein